MKSSTKDKVKGAFHEARGKAKEMAGKLTDNPKLESKGKAEKIAGKVQEKVGQVKKVLGGVVGAAYPTSRETYNGRDQSRVLSKKRR